MLSQTQAKIKSDARIRSVTIAQSSLGKKKGASADAPLITVPWRIIFISSTVIFLQPRGLLATEGRHQISLKIPHTYGSNLKLA